MAIWDWLQLLLLLAISGATALLLALWRTSRDQSCSRRSAADDSPERGGKPASRQDDQRQCIILSGLARLATPDWATRYARPTSSLSGCAAVVRRLPFL